jgi:energy-coupling factor transport system substrate-specific component
MSKGDFQMTADKLKARDLITIAVFTALSLVVYFAIAALMWMIAPLYPFCVAAAMMPVGILWAYLRAKVPKRFSILVQAVLLSIIVFFLGSGWFATAGLLVGGVLAELLSGAGSYRSFKWNTAGYAVFSVSNNLGVFAIILLAKDYYFDFSVQSGMDAAYMNELIGLVSGPVLFLSCALTALSAGLGMLLGRMFSKKHFERAGIV